MTLATTAALLERASADRTAVLAFNVITLEHAEAIVLGAERAGTAVLLQVSENAIWFHQCQMGPLLSACRALAEESAVPIGIHLDHLQDERMIRSGILAAERLGVSSVMVDAAQLDYADNVATTAELTLLAHGHGLWVEAELGEVGGKDGAHAPGVRTDPAEAADFVSATSVDGLAVAVGSSHAMISRDATLDLGLIARLADRVPVPLVLHGSSGVPDETIRAAVEAGIRKVNVGTGLNIAYTSEVRAFLLADASATDPRKYLTGARTSMSDVVEHLCGVISG